MSETVEVGDRELVLTMKGVDGVKEGEEQGEGEVVSQLYFDVNSAGEAEVDRLEALPLKEEKLHKRAMPKEVVSEGVNEYQALMSEVKDEACVSYLHGDLHYFLQEGAEQGLKETRAILHIHAQLR